MPQVSFTVMKPMFLPHWSFYPILAAGLLLYALSEVVHEVRTPRKTEVEVKFTLARVETIKRKAILPDPVDDLCNKMQVNPVVLKRLLDIEYRKELDDAIAKN